MATTVETTQQKDGWIQASFDQSAAEAGTLVADPGDGCRVRIKDFVATMSAAGTLTLLSGATTNLIGVMPMAAGVPLVLPGEIECAPSEVLTLTTVTTAAKGGFKYKIVTT